jgi:hypothetical protein
MMESLTGLLIGITAASIGYVVLTIRMRRRADGGMATTVFSSIENMRSVGELSAFRIHSKEIVTAEDHSWGHMGRKYLNWLWSTKKMALILTFDTDFKYDLRSPKFKIQRSSDTESCHLTMPPCYYDIRIRDISIYDEQEAKLLPWLVPDMINNIFGAGFGPAQKNELIEEAKKQASAQARQLVDTMRSEVQESAQQSLTSLARGFGVISVSVEFAEASPIEKTVEYGVEDAAA